jgi:Flp pilus assembly protein TadG
MSERERALSAIAGARPRRVPGGWLSFLADRRGVSAIEFTLIAPILILAYVGAVELGTALTIDRRVSTVASTAADLVAQEKTTSNADLQDVVAAATTILAPYLASPYSPTQLKIALTSVVADQNNAGKVDWSYASNGATARAKNSSYPTPTGLTQANGSVIVAEVTYDFKPLVNIKAFTPGSFKMTRTFYARPRKSVKVTKTD